ncbi:glycoside hydrolase [Gloeophyllum trabeum ATCC 11539]|uniref:Glycoside hydrolase n=1 Tax=Gloeophyllum trabeum (strain ATCC 11539 / FP-39264 / Madison 617) TaxID=670483 RepID=S7QIQ5_GLOTA|nr:glycoside hydrolase [Gloeophyllum trabeum ATCC 11539]EPQ59486.1 glycoside hydrolase [Gloeophyllum trabeum ATCC 11539]
MAYYPDWAGLDFPPEKIDFGRFDWIDFAFALPSPQFGLTWDDPTTAPMLLNRLVAAAHAKGKKVKLSIGGWTGAKYFSPAVSSAANREIFVNNIVETYHKYELDGIDIDWEYPGQPGQEGNIWTQDDTSNYFLFLVLLRSQLPPTARISAATQVVPFADQNGQPLKNVTPFASVLDWILIMNYDVWGSSSNPGPNAPLSNACGNSTQPEANAYSAIGAWVGAGMPASKIVLGVPSYGYISRSTATKLRTRAGLEVDGEEVTVADAVILKNEDGGSDNGQLQFSDLVSQGALVGPSFDGAGGFTRHWDECSSTPYLTSTGAEQVITYDDPQSLQLKAALAKEQGLLGVNMFDVHGDTDQWDLIDAVRKGLGLIH